MQLSNKHIVEILSAAAVVASLIFVGLQLMFDRNVAMGEQYQLRAQTALDNTRANFANDAFIRSQVVAWERGNLPNWWSDEVEDELKGRFGANLNLVDIYRIVVRIQMTYLQIDNVHYQYVVFYI